MASPIITELEVTKKLVAFGERAAKRGLDLSVDLQPCIDDSEQMQRLVRYIKTGCPSLGTGMSYDAATVYRILGLLCECSDPVPKAEDGEIVVYYGGWSLGDLVGTGKVVNHLSKEREVWKAEAGYYHVLLPVPDSNRKTWNQQTDEESGMLARQHDGWQPIPATVGATALAVHFAASGEDLLKGDFVRCAEALPDVCRAALFVREGRVHVGSCWDDDSYDRVFLGADRKF